MKQQTYTVHDITLNTYRTDGDKPPIVLVHGYTDSALCWQTLIDYLAPRYTVFAYDSRGHGQSSRVTAPYNIADLTHECGGLIQQLGVGKVGLIGHSMGAAITLGVCAEYGEWVDWAILEDPPFYDDANLFVPNMTEWKQGIALLQASPREAVADYYRTQNFPTWSEADRQPRVDARRELDIAIFDYMQWAGSPRWQDYAQKIQCQGLLITGDPAQGALTSPTVAQHLQAIWQHCIVESVADVGHHIRCAAPTAYYQILDAFLAKQQK